MKIVAHLTGNPKRALAKVASYDVGLCPNDMYGGDYLVVGEATEVMMALGHLATEEAGVLICAHQHN